MGHHVLLPVGVLNFHIAEFSEFLFDILDHWKTCRQAPAPQVQIIRHGFAIRLQYEGTIVQFLHHIQAS